MPDTAGAEVLFADLVEASGRVQATRARSEKTRILADLLRRLDRADVEVAVSFLSGHTRQGRVGIGWATIGGIDATPADHPSLTVGEVDRAVGQIEGLTGSGSATARRDAVGRLFGRATPEEADFLRRLLLGELRQGALEGVMADAVAAAAGVPATAVRRAAMFAGDLAAVAAIAMTSGEAGLAAVALQPLRPVQPMLAATAPDVASAVGECGLASVEWKLDGARIQAHRAGDEVRLYTRNLNDVTDRLPTVVDVVRSLPADEVVLDGEVLGVGDEERPDLFQETMSRFGRRSGEPATGLGVWFFDALRVDGDDLVDSPLVDRLARLRSIAGGWQVPGIFTDDAVEAERFSQEALAAGHEGVMVKSASSTYEAGRRGKGWRKVKPVRTLDLVVLAVEWGSGRRRGWLSNIHLGARDPEAPGRFVMVGKTFKGMTDEMLRWQTARFLELERDRHGHVVEVDPAVVAEIAVDGVQVSTRYPGGVALRFARVRRYRDDKAPADADTIEAVRGLLPGHR